MNLWRRSKSWFQDQSQGSEANDELPAEHGRYLVLQQKKATLNEGYATEKKMLEKRYHKQLLEVKSRFDLEMRRLEERNHEAPRLGRKGKDVAAEIEKDALGGGCRDKEKDLVFESDGLEWDPLDHDIRSYNEADEINSDSWDHGIPSDTSRRGSVILNPRHESEDVESCDSAYSSLSMEFQWKFLLDEDKSPMPGYKNDDGVEQRVEQLRLTMRREVIQECEEKFRQERNFLCSIIDELEENVLLLRKQKEDIVTIFECEGKEAAKNEGQVLN